MPTKKVWVCRDRASNVDGGFWGVLGGLSRIAYKKLWKNCEKSGFGVSGVWGAIFIVILWKRAAQKLRRIILLHLGLVTFRFHYGRPLTPYMHDFQIFGRVHDSPNQLF